MAEAPPLSSSDVAAFGAFFRAVEPLKDTLRSGRTAKGRQESTAEHTWRLCLMAIALEEALPEIDLKRLLQILILHDLGEAVHGDIPAPEQTGDKTAPERAAINDLLGLLPAAVAERLIGLWEDYNALSSPEARLAKGLDRLETVLQHVQGANPAEFDYAFNLTYGRAHTDAHPVIRALREPVDAETEERARQRG
jgi:putative hydrolases of HD superfamily